MTKKTPPRRPRTVALALTAAALTAAALLASCSQSNSVAIPITGPTPTTAGPTSTATGTATSTAPSVPTAAGRRIDITVTGKQVAPRPATVNIAVGESLTIAVTSDHDDELHAHAFDVEENVKAGQRLEVTIKGTQPGVYEVELHEPELRLFQVAVR